MTKTPDFAKTMQDMMASFPVDASAFQNAFKTQAAFAEKFSKVAIEAAEKSTEISAKWTKDALAKVGDIARAKAEPAEHETPLDHQAVLMCPRSPQFPIPTHHATLQIITVSRPSRKARISMALWSVVDDQSGLDKRG